MTNCCVVGCNNRYSPSSSLKFYRIPCGNRPFQTSRRRLWMNAIKQANGNNYELSGYARICGAHFVSGELSMDNESPDFVPSVFPNSIQRQNRDGLRRGRSRGLRGNDEIEEKTFSPEAPKAEPPVDPNPPVLMEIEISGETPSLSEPKEEEEALTKEVVPEIKTKTMEMQETSIIDKTLPEQPKGISQVIKMHPVVILKPLIILNGAIHCEQCEETFTSVSELVKHRQMHIEHKSSDSSKADLIEPHPVPKQEPSFPCNMCDQSFTTSRNLKRHKLLHVKDCRKCLRCGTLFCRRHNHFLFWPRPELKTSVQEDSFSAEEDSLDRSFSPENTELDQTSEMSEAISFSDEPSVLSSEVIPKMSKTTETQPPASPIDEPSALIPEQVPNMSDIIETQPPASPTDVPSALIHEQVPTMLETAETRPTASLTDESLVSVPELVPNNPCQSPDIIKPALVSVQPPPVPCPPSPVFTLLTNTDSSIGPTSPMPDDTPDLGQSHFPQYQELPSALKIFSPQYLTSALLDVERNYEYILNRAKTVQIENVVEEEPEEPVFICPVEKAVEPAKGEKIAYDLEIIL